MIWSGIHGFRKGFVIQLFTLIALIVGIYCAFTLSHFVAKYIADSLRTDPTFTNIVAFIITFLGVWALIYLAGKLAHQLVAAVMLGLVNRLLGMFFSLLKTLFIISVLLIVFDTLNGSLHFVLPETLDKSFFYKPIKQVGDTIFPYLQFGSGAI